MGEKSRIPIAFIGEEFGYATRLGAPFYGDYDIGDVAIGKVGLVHATVLAVSTNHFTGSYVYKVRKDYFFGGVDEDWYTEGEVWKMKGMKDVDG